MGFIYLITCLKNNKQYIGQTTKSIVEKRWKDHRYCASVLVRINNGEDHLDNNCPHIRWIKSSTLYRSIAKYGLDQFEFTVIVELPTEELNPAEIKYIKEYGTLLPNGFNATTGGDSKYNHSQESIAKMIKRKLETLENIRHECLRGTPPKCTYSKKLDAIIYVDPNTHINKSFSVKTHGSIEQCRLEAIKFGEHLAAGNKHLVLKKEQDLIAYPGLKATKKGYKLEKYINGKKHQAGFESSKFTREELKASAIDHYVKVILPLIPQK